MLPTDPVILLSFINTQLRDRYQSLSLLCEDYNVLEEDLIKTLQEIDYIYNKEENQFK